MQFFETKSSVPEDRVIRTSITGTGANNPTLTVGAQRLSVTRFGVGMYRYTFGEARARFVGAVAQLGADVPSSLNRFTVVRDTYTPGANGTATIEFAVFNAAGAPADLTALQYLDVWFSFSDTTVGTLT